MFKHRGVLDNAAPQQRQPQTPTPTVSPEPLQNPFNLLRAGSPCLGDHRRMKERWRVGSERPQLVAYAGSPRRVSF